MIDLKRNLIQINNSQIEIFDTIPEDSHECIEARVNNFTQELPNDTKDSYDTENALEICPMDYAVDSSHAQNENNHAANIETDTKNSNIKVGCYIKNKACIPPSQTVYVFVTCNQEFPKEYGIFNPTLNDNKDICSYTAIVQVESCFKRKRNISTAIFAIPITNTTNVMQHVNKGTKLGILQEIEEIKEVEQTQEAAVSLNLIQASEEIINLRKMEFKLNNFEVNHLPLEQKSALQELLTKYDTVFSSSLKSLGHTDLVTPHIRFTSDVPVKTLPYPVPEAMLKEIKNQIEALQEAGIIERSISEWACPMLAVKKKSSPGEPPSFRLALDLRLINSMIRSSAYPLPRIDHIINNISKYKFFTTLDFPSAYHQIHLPKRYRRRLSFTTQWGTFSFRRLMFGLRSAASSFQMMIDAIIEETKQEGIFSYQDDIIIGSNSFQETLDKLAALFKILQKYNVTISPKKSQFHEHTINYLGFHIEDHTISPITSNITKITGFPIPKTKKHLKRFIGLCGFYQKLIPKYSQIMSEFTKITSPKQVFKWTDRHTEIFQQIQKIFFSKPFLNLPNFNKHFFLNTDASNVAISGVLLQERNQMLQPVSYFSKTLSDSEKRYPAVKKELMAIIKSANAFKYFLYNRHFTILSDSKPIEFYKKSSSPIDLTTKWLIDLSNNYDYDFQYVKGTSNVLADYFSREDFTGYKQDLVTNPELINQPDILPLEVNSPRAELHNVNTSQNLIAPGSDFHNQCKKVDAELEISNDTFFCQQREDENLMNIILDITSENPSPKFKNYLLHPDTGLLVIKRKFSNKPNNKIVIPEKLKSKVLTISHMPHFGIYNTYRRILKNFYWRGMFQDTKDFVLSCELCIKHKPHRIPAAPLQEMFIPERPNELVSMDFVGPFSNNMLVLTFLDHFSKHLELFPVKNPTAQIVVDDITKYITTFGRPSALMSDLGPQFTAQIFNHLVKVLKISIVHSSSSHPQTQGSSERINTSLKSSISTLTKQGYNFKQALMIHKSIYNTTVHSSTGYTPAFLHFGRSITNIFDLFEPEELDAMQLPFNYYQYMSSLNKIYSDVVTNMKTAQAKRNARQHQHASLRKFNIDDLVYLKTKDSFKARFIGPFIVVKVISLLSKRLIS